MRVEVVGFFLFFFFLDDAPLDLHLATRLCDPPRLFLAVFLQQSVERQMESERIEWPNDARESFECE